ncbi:hypothetical protein FJY84_04715, partial [Candidatus Bathyarchaeota archaeon]|nr:hypothetical protein [Candidatus Bathyarchaeota archaeon]
MLEEILPILRELSPEIIKILESIVALASVALIYKLVSNYVTRVGDGLELDDHIRNSIRLVIRVVTIVVGATIIFRINNLPTEWFVGG